jgi:hypothetical protein
MAEEPETGEEPEKPPEDKAKDQPTHTFDQRSTFNFYDTKFAPEATFGVANILRTRLTAATGSVEQSDLDTLKKFVPPEGFTDAVERLARDRVIVLCGATGIGKRSSALALLREVTDQMLYMLSPGSTLADLAKETYKQACGYLVIDRVLDGNVIESDFEWRLVRDRLADQGAYLVVTTVAHACVLDSVAHLSWRLPNPEHVLRAHWSAEWPAEHEQTLRETLESADRVVDVVELAGRLTKGESPDVAVTHFDAKLREVVNAWFAERPEHRAVLEITTLAFTPGVNERQYEAALAALRDVMQEHVPEPEPDEDEAAPVEKSMPQPRGERAENELMTTATVPTELGSRGALLFAVPGYHRHVLAELWGRMDVAFWDAVWEWLDMMVQSPEYEQRLAVGLAKLASVAFEEVLPVLDHWARGECGTSGQRAAVYALWFMTHDDSLAPTSLQVATRWITRGLPTHRWVGAMAFSGQLGVCYPHEAINLLWQLCVQAHVVDGDVDVVFGSLFSTLVRESVKDAGIVLTALDGKVKRFVQPGARPRMASVTLRTTLAALSATDPFSKRLAVLVYLGEFPERTDQVAALLAKVLVHRPIRLRAIRLVRTILEDLAKNDDRPEARARDLGNALAARLDGQERDALEREFYSVAARKNKNIASLITVLLDALSALATTTTGATR